MIVLPGVELPPPDRAAFVMRPEDAEALLCYRHDYKRTFAASEPVCQLQAYSATGAAGFVMSWPRPMRDTPAIAVNSMADFQLYNANFASPGAITSGTFDKPSVTALSNTGGLIAATVSLTPGHAVFMNASTSSAFIAANARLSL